ncbi:MAG TPA: LysR substrate-binding domain-containing protein [Polyangiaceae bacterium]|jgi:LysR family hydrogen peroxide-inducible transcriptional activator|nr:LysR substrate-binding domain-containing protein [Polyangiaceae bacterium]
MELSSYPFSLRQLQYAAAVAETLSFRRAAELCHVSQPTLSAQIAELEAMLGVQLFERDRRRVLCTKAGEELALRARRLLVLAGELRDGAARAKDPLQGTLRLGVIPTIAPYLLPELTQPLRRRFPQVTLLWVEDKTKKLVSELEQGNLDGALLALEAEIGSNLDHEVIGWDPFLLVAPKAHPLATAKEPLERSSLAGASVLLLDDGHCFREQALSVCSQASAEELEFRATSLSTLTQMVIAGNGVTLLPNIALASENRLGELAVRSFKRPEPGRTLALVFRHGSALASALGPIARAMREEYVRLTSRGPAPRRPKAGARR